MKKLIIFGFEGTIADTSPGTLYCFNTTASAMGYSPVDRDALQKIIGATLEQGFEILYGMKDDEIQYAVNNYSKLYSQKGEEMMMMYDGIESSLSKLKKDGYKLAIATQQNKRYTADMLKTYHDIGNLFDIVCATDVGSNLNKCDLIMQACNGLGISVQDSVLVGDSYVDAEGARRVGMDFAAVIYGVGFKSKEEVEGYNCVAYLYSAEDIYSRLSVL